MSAGIRSRRRGRSAGPSEPGRLAAFDGLRAVAALSVLAYHVGLVSALARSGPYAPFVSELKAGVSVFFVISGCLLYLPHVRALRAGTGLPDWRRYAQRRALRILPGYWVALTVLVLTPLGAAVVSTNCWRYYGLTQIYNPDTILGGLGVAWSLCVEVTFYALLPLLALGMAGLTRRQRRARRAWVQLAVLAAIAAVSCAIRIALTGGSLDAPVPETQSVPATTLLGFLDWFALGMALAVLACAWEARDGVCVRLAGLAARPGACWALALVFFAFSAATQHGDVFLPMFGLTAHVTAGLGAALLVMPAVVPMRAHAAGPVLRALVHPVAIWLGTISYGIYLWHLIVLAAFRGWSTAIPEASTGLAATAWTLVLVAGGGVALGAASWYLVELPVKRLFAPRRRPAPAVAGS